MMIGNNYKNYIRLVCLLFIASNFSVLLAMPNFNEIDKPGVVAQRNAVDEANKFVRDTYGQLGIQPNGDYVAVGQSVIPGKSGNLKWELSRATSYDKAILNAKAELVKFIAREIGQKALSELEVGNPNDESLKKSLSNPRPGMLDKVKMLLNAKLDKHLKAEGIDPNKVSPEKLEKLSRKIVGSSSFRKTTEVMAEQSICGLVVKKVFLKDGRLAVVVRQSDAMMKLAAAMTGNGPAPKVNPARGIDVDDWIMKLQPSELYTMYGIQVRSDKNGDINIISFAQMPTNRKGAVSIMGAKKAASTDADGYIRAFAGETVKVNELSSKFNEELEYDDANGNEMIEVMHNNYSKNSIESYSEKLKMSGIYTSRQWEFEDKANNMSYHGAIKVWKLSSQEAAKQLGAANNKYSSPDSNVGSYAPYADTSSAEEAGTSSSGGYDSFESEDF